MAAQASTLELQWVRHRPSRLGSWLRTGRRKYLGTASLIIIVTFVAVAITGPLISPYDPLEVHTEFALNAPGGAFALGTDELGRDLLSRLIYGSKVSLSVALGAVCIATVAGISIGLSSAYFMGKYDLIIQRFIDALQAFPSLVLAMVMVATLGASVVNVMLAIAITTTAGKARIVRGAALSVKENQYVDAARAMGGGGFRIMVQHLLPNIWAPIIVFFSLSMGAAIIRESSLSFLGLGPPPPNPTWGSMLSGSARNYMSSAPWMALAPGLAITFVVLAFNLLGDALRDILDPRLRGSQ